MPVDNFHGLHCADAGTRRQELASLDSRSVQAASLAVCEPVCHVKDISCNHVARWHDFE